MALKVSAHAMLLLQFRPPDVLTAISKLVGMGVISVSGRKSAIAHRAGESQANVDEDFRDETPMRDHH